VDKYECTVGFIGHMMKNWMGMSGQLWVDSGNQKHSDRDQPGKYAVL